MKKRITLFFILSLFFSLVLPIPNEVSSLEDGAHYTYIIKNAGYYLEIGANKKTVDGYLFGPYIYPRETRVNSTIASIDFNGVTVVNWVENLSSYVFLSIDWFDYFAVFNSYYTLYHTFNMVRKFGNGFVIDLTLFNIQPYVDLVFNSYPFSSETLGEDICDFFGEWSYWYPTIECSYNYSEENDITYFESWVGGEVDSFFGLMFGNEFNFQSDISFGNNFHFAIDKTTGIVHGFGRQGWVEGIINDLSVKVSLVCEYVLKDYELPSYQFGEFRNYLSPPDNYIIPIIAVPTSIIVVSFSVLIIFYSKKNRKVVNP